MKKLFKIILFLLCLITQVKAKEYEETFLDKVEWISGDYVNKQKGSSKKYQQMYTIKRKSDKRFVYCIEPGVSIKEGKLIKGYDEDYLDVTKFTSEQWDRITKLAYYGYGYKDGKYDHTGIHWYTITQFMIWKTVPNGYDIYFTDTLNGKRITKYQKEINEMETILSNYHKLPSFNDNTYVFNVNNEKVINDDNNVISSFNSLTKDSNYSINNNQVLFNINHPGTYNYEFDKANNKYGYLPVVYIDSASQNLMSVGDVVNDKARVTIKVVGGTIIGHKLDEDTMGNTPQGSGSLEGAIYGIYDMNHNLIHEVVTDSKGEFQSNYLDYGDYYLKEIKPSRGYLLDPKEYLFTINDQEENPIINLYEKVIIGKLEIKKYSLSNGEKKVEANAKFQVLDKDNNIYKEAITDKDGYLVFDLPYGTYTIRQIEGLKNYKKVDNFKVTIDKEEVITKELINEALEAKVKVIKKDFETKEIIKLEGIKFKIYDVDNNKYYCESDSCTFSTNKEGYFITQKALLYGHYRLEEVNDTIKGYYWNKEPLNIVIDDNTKIKEISFYNKPIKGTLEFSKIDYSTSDPLPNTLIEVYDINDNLVFSGRTNKEGKLIINNLPIGKYYILEKEAPEGYLLNEYKMYFEIKDDSIIKATMKDERIVGNIKIKKIGEQKEFNGTNYSYNDIPLDNISFGLYAREDIIINEKLIYPKDTLVNIGSTNKDGILEFNNLYLGKYYLKELNTKDCYILDTKEYDIELKKDKDISLTYKNYLKKSTFEFTKTSISDSEPLPNTLMEFYDIDNNLILRERTNNEGKIIIKDLPYGKYYYKELEAPIGYEVNPDKHYFEILEDNVIIKDTLSDNLIKVPDTYKSYSPLIIVIRIILLGGTIVIFKKNR